MLGYCSVGQLTITVLVTRLQTLQGHINSLWRDLCNNRYQLEIKIDQKAIVNSAKSATQTKLGFDLPGPY